MGSNYKIVEIRPTVVFLVDLNTGGMSVTNDAERVTAEVAAQFPWRRIVYRDSDGRWDELLHNNGVFQMFGQYTGSLPQGDSGHAEC